MANVDRFLAPSRFLRDRFVAWGIPEDRIEHAPYGLEQAPFEGFERAPSAQGKLRIAFLGTLAPHKAPHLVLEAWARLPEALRARAEVVLHGPKTHFPEYVEELEALARRVGASLPGGLAREEIPGAFRSIDLLVVPSTWYENQPLTLLEARATRTPALASDLGGMRELVDEGRTGWCFPTGDAGALAGHFERILTDPGQLASLDFEDAAPPTMLDTAERMLARYRTLLGAE